MSKRRVIGVLSVLAIALAAVALLVGNAAPKRTGSERAAGEAAAAAGASELRAGSRRGITADAPSAATPAPPIPPPPPPVPWQPRSIRGRLLFPDGSPAPKVRIALGSIATRRSVLSASRSVELGAETDDRGSFEIGSLDEGLYLATADDERDGRRWVLRREVEPGPDEVSWTLDEERLALTVHVLDPDGAKVPSASVHLVVGGRAIYAFASDGVAHFYEHRDARLVGPAALVAQLFEGEGPMDWAPTAIEGVDLSTGEATIRCERGGVIEGHVAAGAGGRVPAGTVYARAKGGGIRDHVAERKAPIGPDGGFRFEGMAAGPWRLHAWGPFYATLTDDVVANVGDRDVVLTPFATTTVRVRVVDPDGRPVAGASVFSDMSLEERKAATTDADGVAILAGVRPGVPRSLRAVTTETPPRGAGRGDWLPEDTTLTLEREPIGDATVSGVVRDTTGAPISFVAVWGRQGTRVGKAYADEGGRFGIEGLVRGSVTLEVRLAEGWDQPESMEVATTVATIAPAQGVDVAVELGATLHVRFANWPYDVDREGAVLVDEAGGALVRPISWTWDGVRFGRLASKAAYTLFAHAPATDRFTKSPGLRAGKDVMVRLERGETLEGRVLGVDADDKTTVVATLHGVAMEADVASDGRFEVRGLPADATAEIVATTVTPGGARREARALARAGDANVELTPIAVPPTAR